VREVSGGPLERTADCGRTAAVSGDSSNSYINARGTDSAVTRPSVDKSIPKMSKTVDHAWRPRQKLSICRRKKVQSDSRLGECGETQAKRS
jgi:hypothetical protein